MTAAADKLHLGIVLHSLGGGGAQRFALRLAETLIRRGWRVDILVGRFTVAYPDSLPEGMRLYYPRLRKSDREVIRRCRERGVEVKPLSINPLSAVRDWLVLRRKRRGININIKGAVFAHLVAHYIRQERPTLLLAAVSTANFAAVNGVELAAGSLPVVISVHSTGSSGYGGSAPPLVIVSVRNSIYMSYSEYEQRLARALYPKADSVVAVSQGVGREVAQFLDVNAERIHTIYNPIPSDAIWQAAQEETGHPWFADGQPPVILSVGREAPAKDYPTLVAAFGQLRRTLRARLVIMGHLSEPYRAGLVAQAQDYGVADDLGFIDFDENPFRYMRRARLFALSSLWEGLPNVLLEALACGAPVVSTDTPHGPREILEDGKWGKLTPVGDAPALARAMVETLQGDRTPEAALRRRAAEFSEQRAADRYLELFEKVVGRPG